MVSVEVFSKTTTESKLVLRLPPDSKPLMASLKLSGDFPGLLSSYYHPEKHAWIVRRTEVVHVEQPGVIFEQPVMDLKLVVLLDPHNEFELFIGLSSYTECMKAENALETERNSQCFKELFPSSSSNTTGVRSFLSEKTNLPSSKRAVTLAATVPVDDGYVLTGGGFCSLYPVLNFGPGLPFSFDTLYNVLLGLEEEEERGGKTTGGSGASEYSGWTVRAAPNTGLAAFAIGLRRRPLLSGTTTEGAVLLGNRPRRLMSPAPGEGGVPSSYLDGTVISRLPSAAPVRLSPEFTEREEEPLGASYAVKKSTQEVLEMLTARRCVSVHHGVEDQLWTIAVPGLTKRGCPLYSLRPYSKGVRDVFYTAL
ncbi:hypothetical protein ADEAN_000370100 [Angomonas deanei]|uniref:Uncharacterized protein n=1 Tax=Angomonas deanei TaxID=59799 RepID=A0A7G2C8V3_9TRYP|nr:hypothetical protein ADEAN_000370100 [Angomonas deanei]